MPRKLGATKHFHLFQHLRTQFKWIPPGRHVPTMQELMRTYGVSRATVERALVRLQQEGLILRPAGKQRFVVADVHDRGVRRIALLRAEDPSGNSDAIARSVVEAGKRHEWAFEPVSYRDLRTLELKRAIGNRDAAVLVPSCAAFPAHVAAALDRPDRPIVVLQDHVRRTHASDVCVDDAKVGRLAVEHLARLGHRRIHLLIDQPRDSAILERLRGWREAMMQIIGADVDDLILDGEVETSRKAIDIVYERVSAWLEGGNNDFSAVVCTSTVGALAGMRALREHHIDVPDQVSLIACVEEASFGAFMNPPLTTVEIDLDEYGRAVVEVLEEMLVKPDAEPRHVRIDPYLVVRETTGPAAGEVPASVAGRTQP